MNDPSQSHSHTITVHGNDNTTHNFTNNAEWHTDHDGYLIIEHDGHRSIFNPNYWTAAIETDTPTTN